jgi:esterase/lipase
MRNVLSPFLITAAVSLVSACAATPPLYESSSTQLGSGKVDSYSAYLDATRRHLEQNLVALPDYARRDQIEWNMPFRNSLPDGCKEHPTHGILLVHGLSDSPFVFRDFARALATDCVEVRTVLLQGHGTRPGDMITAEADVWREQIRHHFTALADDVDVALIGGFSLGGALATELALSDQQPRPDGLVRQLNGLDNFLWLAGTANLFFDFVEREPEFNPVKYESLTVNAAIQLADVLEGVERRFAVRTPSDLPLFLVASEADSVINLPYLLDTFNTRFPNPGNRMTVFRDQRLEWPYPQEPRLTLINGYRPDLNILEFSHQSLPAAPDNELYGVGKPLQRCLEPNQLSVEDCRALPGDQLWFSAYSDNDQPEFTSRLTYNPAFDRLTMALSEFILSVPLREKTSKMD